MKLKLNFTLKFESDWHVNAGFGADGKADAVIECDPLGKPIISGATLKGIFRDALYDLARNFGKSHEDAEEFTHMLGTEGVDSPWRFSAASRLPQASVVNDSIAVTGVRIDPRYRRAEDNKYFVRELGAADVFTFSVAGAVPDSEALEQIEWLLAAASYIERLGGRRRRGNGKCVISIVNQDLHKEILDSFENRHCGGTRQITDNWKTLQAKDDLPQTDFPAGLAHRCRIILYTERPVIIAEKPEAGNVYQGQIIIPGQTLRGAFAELAHPNDLSDDKYRQFKKMFILGGLKFSHLHPLEVMDDVGIPIAQLPLGLQQVDGTPECCFTSVFQVVTEKKAASGWVYLQNGLQKASYSTESHPHVRIDPRLKRASDGDLYTYEAIPAGRYYTGELYLEDKDWQELGKLLHVNLNESFELRIGKGRNRSYGQCKAVIVPMEENDPPAWIHVPLEARLNATSPDELFITLATDTILQDIWGRFYGKFSETSLNSYSNNDNEPAAQWLAECFGTSPQQVRVESPDAGIHQDEKRPAQVVRTKLIESFDTRSGLPRWRDKALVAGSTARIVFTEGKRPSPVMLRRIETQGVGLRRGEGYGRVVFNHPAHTGQWSGFTGSVDISTIRPDISTEPTTETVESFSRSWKQKVKEKLREQNLTSGEINHSLARQLIEIRGTMTNQDLSEKLPLTTTIQKDKNSYKAYMKTRETVISLLEEVKRDNSEHWQRALVLLAESLMNNREKA